MHVRKAIRRGGWVRRRDKGRLGRRALSWASLLLTAALVLPEGAARAEPAGPQLAQSESARLFDIPPQPLVPALERFADQSGLSFAYKTADLAGIASPGVSGSHTTAEALHRLLAGTGVGFTFSGPRSVVLHPAATQPGAAAPAGPAEAEPITFDAITVAGEKVERPYLETYTSVGIATEKDIVDYHLEELNQVFETMANVRAFPAAGGNNGFAIRGVNSDGITQPTNSAPLISVIIDGATQSAEGLKRGSRGTWDVKQIEVLRGPQSTLQGRNSLAGAVVVETNDPTYEPEFVARGAIGNLERMDAAAVASGPIIEDQLAVRLAGEYRNQKKEVSFADALNEPLADDEYWNVRGKVLFQPEVIDPLTVLLTVSHVYDQPSAVSVTGPDFFDRHFDAAATFTETRKMDVDNYIADVAYALDGGLTIRSLSAVNRTDLTIESVPGSLVYDRNEHRKDFDFTQDLRLEILDVGSGLSGVAGVFYGDFDQTTESYIGALGAVFQDGTFENDTNTIAVYGDLRYRFWEDFSLLGGLRFQHDRIRNASDLTSDFGPTSYDRTTDNSVLLPKAGLAYDIDDEQSVALIVSRGYRQGMTEAIPGSVTETNEVDPEFVWTYELAYRLETLDQSLLFGANAFYNRYRNQQIAKLVPGYEPLTTTVNAGNSWSIGAEFEGRYDFGNGLNVFGSLGFLKTEFGDFEDASCEGGDCAGNAFPEAPNYTFSVGGAYQHRTGLFFSAWGDYTGGFYAGDINNDRDLYVDGRFIANSRAGYAGEHIQAFVFVDNVFDKDYLTNRSLAGNEATVGDGRLFGIELRVQF